MLSRQAFGLHDEFALLTVGRLDPRERYKGHDRVIRALATLRLDGRRIVYLVAGEGQDQHRLSALAHELGVNHDVRFLGSVDEALLPSLYSAADLFVLPSTGEGFGIAFLEAMACGTPSLGLAVGGAPDALGDGTLGDCVGESSFEAALARAIARPPPDRAALSAETVQRFGKLRLAADVIGALTRLKSHDRESSSPSAIVSRDRC
jgi:phosphatidylinositol alpha-1,6-mannosyltransferase